MTQHDPDLLERLEALDRGAFEGVAYRVVWWDRSAVQGSSGSGGRWNDPARRFEILNTSLERDGAAAEFEAFWSLFEQRSHVEGLHNSAFRSRGQSRDGVSGAVKPVCVNRNVASAATNSTRSDIGNPRLAAWPAYGW